MSASTFQVERTTFDGDMRAAFAAFAARPGSSFSTPLTTTVPKELVHRSAVAEVVLTDWARVDDTHFVMAAQWPRGHSFFTPVAGGHHDPLIACETVRQIGILLGHAEFGVPFGHHFAIRDIHIDVEPRHLRVGLEPAALTIDVTCTEVNRRGTALSGLRFEAVLHRDGHVVATGGGSFSCMAPAVYRRIRSGHTLDGDWYRLPLISPAAPQSVGRMSPMDVVLSPTGEQDLWRLRVDTSHPVLFEHAVDHVPGMVLLEAARQATAAALGRSSYLPLGLASEFTKYAELDTPCMIEAVRAPHTGPDGEETVVVTARQAGEAVFTSTVRAGRHGS
ncbi:ScbA/BarX family gamma-butyrolactone biosynthesis protein [Streptomyces sp. 2P-4]|uniref:ScbA/BarX family gamma-butyrolactone biosynthesis protein n=1 Tax=Streptomyces sp. 2P-4 TaxID=2931974 RepID=UPI0025402ECA|nr:ScbA/BarX family gamma-butyrolactone biosynthesis protein [Streptomyces sp. 2P-4]